MNGFDNRRSLRCGNSDRQVIRHPVLANERLYHMAMTKHTILIILSLLLSFLSNFAHAWHAPISIIRKFIHDFLPLDVHLTSAPTPALEPSVTSSSEEHTKAKVTTLKSASLPGILPFPIPPWRGPRQLLHIGPWGVHLDKLLSHTDIGGWGWRKPNSVLYIVDGNVDHNDDDIEGVNRVLLDEPILFDSPSQLPSRPTQSTSQCSFKSQAVVRIVFVSDTHGKHRSITLPEGDVLIHCGDVQSNNFYQQCGGMGGVGYDALNDFDEWLGTLPHGVKLIIGGNHDAALETVEKAERESRMQGNGRGNWIPKNGILLNSTIVSIPIPLSQEGPEMIERQTAWINVFGTPVSPPGITLCDAFQNIELGEATSQAAMEYLLKDGTIPMTQSAVQYGKKVKQSTSQLAQKGNIDGNYPSSSSSPIPGRRSIDILVTHARNSQFEPVVFPSIFNSIDSNSDTKANTFSWDNFSNTSKKNGGRPRIWAYGHFHNEHGIRREWHVDKLAAKKKQRTMGEGSCLCINAASCDMIYRPLQPVIVVDYVVSK